MTRRQILDLYFMDARSKLIDLAAFMDRVGRADGADDFRMQAFRRALSELSRGETQNAQRVLMTFSDPSTGLVEKADGKGATGAWPGKN